MLLDYTKNIFKIIIRDSSISIKEDQNYRIYSSGLLILLELFDDKDNKIDSFFLSSVEEIDVDKDLLIFPDKEIKVNKEVVTAILEIFTKHTLI